MLLLVAFLAAASFVQAQTRGDGDDDIWRSVRLGTVDYQKAKNYAVRLYAYYRYVDDGKAYIGDRQIKLYNVFEGICSVDIRYGRDEDDGADVIVGRNLVHPDLRGEFMDYYELKPYTFLEKARRDPKRYTIEEQGDTTRVYTKRGLAGTAVRDTLAKELRISYNALSPDTSLTLNLIIVKGHMSHVDAEAVYRLDDNDMTYVPQGHLKRIVFEGDFVISTPLSARISNGNSSVTGLNMREDFHERTEIYVDSVVYMTRDEFRADKALTAKERRERSGYVEADIDRLKQKHQVPPLTDRQLQRIEDQRDWDDEFEHWDRNDKHNH